MPALSGFLYKLKTPNTQAVAEQTALPDVSNAFFDITGIQTSSLSGSASEVEITSKSTGENRSILNKRGVLSLEVTAEGISQDSQLQKDLHDTFLRQQLRWFSVEREDGRKFIARFKITSYNTSASHDSAQTFNLTLMSSGVLYVRDTSGFAYDTSTDRITAFASQVSPFNYFLFSSSRYFASQLPARGSARVTALSTILTALATPVNANKLSGTPTGNITLRGPMPSAPVSETLTFTLNASQYKGFSRAGNYLISGTSGQLAPDIPNLLELVANPDNVYATVAPANKAWLIEGAELVTGGKTYTFGEYDDTHNRAKMLDSDGNEVRGDSISIERAGETWDDATARDTLLFTWQIKNQYAFPILLLQKSVLANKVLQILDPMDADITEKFGFLGEKTDNTGVVWNAYYLDTLLLDNEMMNIKVQIGD